MRCSPLAYGMGGSLSELARRKPAPVPLLPHCSGAALPLTLAPCSVCRCRLCWSASCSSCPPSIRWPSSSQVGGESEFS